MPETAAPPLYRQCLKAFVEIQVAQEFLDKGDADRTMQALQGVRSTLEDVLFALSDSESVRRN